MNFKRVALVGIYLQKKEEDAAKAYLDELAALCKTYGLESSTHFPVKVRSLIPETLIGKGKLEERRDKATNCDLFIFDEELTPSQQRNLEKVFQKPVLDRSELILEVFTKQARSKEARLQIELAKAQYELPRLRRMWTHLSRQSGSGQLKGEGEQQIEIDRRLLKKKISKLKNSLQSITKQREAQRKKRIRNEVPIFALVGYTNVGKSTLINALTQSNVFVEDKLFATLDTRTKTLVLPNHQKCLIIDTVGFVRKLPHNLVASFRSTLEEILYADYLIHVVDTSSLHAKEQAETTLKVLNDLGVKPRAIITVLNKIDQCQNMTILNCLRLNYPVTVTLSAIHKTGVSSLINKIQELTLNSTRINNEL